MEKTSSMVHVDNFSINRPVALPAASIFLEQTGIPIASTPMSRQNHFPGVDRG